MAMTKNLKIIFAVLVLITVASLVSVFLMSNKLNALKSSLPGGDTTTVADIQKVVADVGKHLVLPDNETPTMASVSDPAKLKDQPFFDHALQGDLVLIYSVSRKAILWRPSTQQIIEVSSINLPPPASAQSVVPEPTPASVPVKTTPVKATTSKVK